MTSEYESPKIPQEMKDDAAKSETAAAGLRQAVKEGRIQEMEKPAYRTFLAPTEPNTVFLVIAGTPRIVHNQGAPLGLASVASRDGDKVARFSGGVCATNDKDIILWLEAHSGSKEAWLEYHASRGTDPGADRVSWSLVRDINMKGVEAWAEMKAHQVNTSRQAAIISPNMDVDSMFSDSPREMIRDPNSLGSQYVDRARGDVEVRAAHEEETYRDEA